MAIIDRMDVATRARAGEHFCFELGCGPRKVDPKSIGVDMLDVHGVDMVGDIFEVLASLPDACADAVFTSHFFEHVADLPTLLKDVARIMAPGARLTVVVPHFSNPFYYSDPTHKTPFGLYTMAYFCRQRLFSRTMPDYGVRSGLVLQSVHLGFKSYPPRYLRHGLKKIAETVFNSTMYLREFYEENLCWLVPCYEVRFELVREEAMKAQNF